jgi:hypothetical protein
MVSPTCQLAAILAQVLAHLLVAFAELRMCAWLASPCTDPAESKQQLFRIMFRSAEHRTIRLLNPSGPSRQVLRHPTPPPQLLAAWAPRDRKGALLLLLLTCCWC